MRHQVHLQGRVQALHEVQYAHRMAQRRVTEWKLGRRGTRVTRARVEGRSSQAQGRTFERGLQTQRSTTSTGWSLVDPIPTGKGWRERRALSARTALMMPPLGPMYQRQNAARSPTHVVSQSTNEAPTIAGMAWPLLASDETFAIKHLDGSAATEHAHTTPDFRNNTEHTQIDGHAG